MKIRTINTILFALIAMLTLAMIANAEEVNKLEADSDYISWVKIYIDKDISATSIRPMLNGLGLVKGVAKVTVDSDRKFLIITQKKNEKLNILSIQKEIQHIGHRDISMEKSFLHDSNKIEVVAQGSLIKVPVIYSFSVAEKLRHTHDRYKFQVGDNEFILSQTGKLNELIKSGYDRVRIEGTIITFTSRIPVMVIVDFEPAGPKEESILVKGIEGSGQGKTKNISSLLGLQMKIPEKDERSRINTIRVYMDGVDNCSKCADHIKETLQKEDNVNIANIDSEKGFVDIVPKGDKKFDLYNLGERISKMGPYTVIKMDVVTSGIVTETKVSNGKETHKQYTLAVGKHTSFILSENDKLNELLKSEDKAITVIGTVVSFNKDIPILEISDFQKLEK